ncbi:MAG: alginate lyase family protein [Candidatus Acidiferrales bacterium]
MEHIRVFDLKFPLGFEFDWHRDYHDGRQVDRRFAGALNIRDTAVVGDIKYVWEPSRHQHLSALAYAANAEQHADYIFQSLDTWLNANPYLRGVHWTSSLELAERMLSWALLYPRIADRIAHDRDFRERWLSSIYLHLARIARKLSLHTSANNHLIGELVGLYVGSSCFNFWPECRAWRHFAGRSLEREIRLQVGEDGVNREQAISYHLFTLELLLLAFVIARNTGTPFSDEYAQRLRAMAQFLDTVTTSTGDMPLYGDSDDARGFLFSERETALEVTTQLAGLLFREPTWLRFRTAPTQAARALIPELLPRFDRSARATLPPRELFADAGMACVRTNDGKIRLLMDFGSLGFNSTAAHGHADALSVWLSIGDEYFLIDAGTYAYHSHPEWRAFFRSTAAHNTSRVDHCDQSEMTGRFLWGSKAAARLLRMESNPEYVTVEAEHDGYARLPDPVIHRRAVGFDRSAGSVRVEDSFQCAGRHEIEIFFHMHEEAKLLNVCDGEVQVAWRGHRVVFSSPDRNTRWDVVSGSENPRLGWRSQQFNQKQPIATLRIRAEIDGPTRIRTNLDVYSRKTRPLPNHGRLQECTSHCAETP